MMGWLEDDGDFVCFQCGKICPPQVGLCMCTECEEIMEWPKVDGITVRMSKPSWKTPEIEKLGGAWTRVEGEGAWQVEGNSYLFGFRSSLEEALEKARQVQKTHQEIRALYQRVNDLRGLRVSASHPFRKAMISVLIDGLKRSAKRLYPDITPIPLGYAGHFLEEKGVMGEVPMTIKLRDTEENQRQTQRIYEKEKKISEARRLVVEKRKRFIPSVVVPGVSYASAALSNER